MNAPKQKYLFHSGDARWHGAVKYYKAVKDEAAGSVRTPAVFIDADFIIRGLSGTEATHAAQQKMTVTNIIMMRFFPGLTNDMWIDLDDGTTYAIRGIVNVNMRNRVYMLWCDLSTDLR